MPGKAPVNAGGEVCTALSRLPRHDNGLEIEKRMLIYPGSGYTVGFEWVDLNGGDISWKNRKSSGILTA